MENHKDLIFCAGQAVAIRKAEKEIYFTRSYENLSEYKNITDEKFDIIFIDPPYDYVDEKSLNGIIRTALKLLENQGIIVCEHPMKEEIKLDVANYRVKKYKDKYITFCEKL